MFLYAAESSLGFVLMLERLRHSAVRSITKRCVGKQKCALGYSIRLIDDIIQRITVESAFSKSPTAVF